MEEQIKKGASSRGISEDAYRARLTSSLWGTPEIVAEKIGQYKDQDITHITLMFPYGEERKQIETFGEFVAPLL